MSQYVSDLCVLLVKETYGELCAQVFQGLCSHGRCTAPVLQNVTQLSMRLCRYALSVLIQQHLIFWHTSSLDEQTNYEANLLAAYNLMRIGKDVQMVESRFGPLEGQIVSKVIQLGHVKVSDLVHGCDLVDTEAVSQKHPLKTTSSARSTKTAPSSDATPPIEPSHSPSELRQRIGSLLQYGLLSLVHESHFWSDADIETEVDKVVPEIEAFKARTQKEKRAMRDVKLSDKRLEWKYGTRGQLSRIESWKVGSKRALHQEEQAGSRKKLKLDVYGSSRDSESFDFEEAGTEGTTEMDNLIVSLNHEKFTSMARNDLLVSIVEQKIGSPTARVYKTVLRIFERRLGPFKEAAHAEANGEQNEEDEEWFQALPKTTTRAILDKFPDASQLVNTLGEVDPETLSTTSIDHPKKHRRKSDEPHEYRSARHSEYSNKSRSQNGTANGSSAIAFASDDDLEDVGGQTYLNGDATAHPIYQHLLLLAQHPEKFVEHISAMDWDEEQWAVDKFRLNHFLALQIMFQTISSRFSIQNARIARICHEKGRLDDKTLCTLSLLSQKDLRARLLSLQKAGFLEQQEVPRDNARVASRTTFLYYFDERKCRAKILENCHKTLLRCLQRLLVEKEKIAGVLEKLERSDVKGREDDLLGDMEKEGLSRWRSVEETIWGEIGHVDTIACILRDS